MTNSPWNRIVAVVLWAIVGLAAMPALGASEIGTHPVGSPQDVLTFHHDNLRTGWFSAETTLTASNVNSQSFGLLQTVMLDGRVDAEPLVVMHQNIVGQGFHDVVYVATENDSVYAIDANDGTILWQRKYGTAVPDVYKLSDDNIFPIIGISSTPVIDRSRGVIYFVADHYGNKSDTFYLHKVLLSTGQNIQAPVAIQFTEKLPSGIQWTFNPRYNLQRPGLLESNASIYIAFGSNGDSRPQFSRGTILRYDAATLTQISGQVTNQRHRYASPYYLTSIWQSGYAPAADDNGDIYFSTGNSDPKTPSYSAHNHPHSMIRMPGDLSTVLDSFTPYNYFDLEVRDADVGSGGMMLLPDQPGSIPHLAVAGGKDGRAFLLDRDHMGGFTPGGPDNVLQVFNMGKCWCGPAFFVGSDGASYVLTGGRSGVISWKLQTSPTVQLTAQSSSGHDRTDGLPANGGTVPVVSSNGTAPGSAVVWHVQKPATSTDNDPGTELTLWAFSGADLSQPLLSISAGTWVHAVNSNANLVPTIANGKVYIASNKQLRIFGLFSDRKRAAAVPKSLMPSAPDVINCAPSQSPLRAVAGSHAPEHDFYGTICRMQGSELRLNLRGGHSITMSIDDNFTRDPLTLLTVGRTIHVGATIDAKGVARVRTLSPSHTISSFTPRDR